MGISLGLSNIIRSGGAISGSHAGYISTPTNTIVSSGQLFTVSVVYGGGDAVTQEIPAITGWDVGTVVTQTATVVLNGTNVFSQNITGTITAVEPGPNNFALYYATFNSFTTSFQISSPPPLGQEFFLSLALSYPFGPPLNGYSISGTQPSAGGIKLGTTFVDKVYLGAQQVWPVSIALPGSSWDGSLTAMPAGVADYTGDAGGNYLAELLFYDDGTIRTRSNSTGVGVETTVGNWSGVVANSTNTELRFEIIASSNPSLVSNGASSYTAITGIKAVSISGENISFNSAIVRVYLRETADDNTVIIKDISLTAGSLGGGGGGGDPEDPEPPVVEQ